jgi:hypothetical protein
VFDFEGSMIAPINRFFRAFGGRQAPYLRVSRATRIAAGALGMRNVARRGIAALGRGRSEQALPAAHTPPRACD